MISSKVIHIIKELDDINWTYCNGRVYTSSRSYNNGDEEVYHYIVDLMRDEGMSKSYAILFNEGDHIIRVIRKFISNDYEITLMHNKDYKPIEIYMELSKAINYLEEQFAKGTVSLKHAFNSFYGMYVDSDNVMANKVYTDNFTANKVYSGDSKVYFKNASYVAAAMSELSNISKNPKFPGIDRVISNKPYTIVLWEDGTKTIVKQQPGETKYDPEKGLAMCIVKKMYGNNKWYDIFKRNLDPKYTKRKKVK